MKYPVQLLTRMFPHSPLHCLPLTVMVRNVTEKCRRLVRLCFAETTTFSQFFAPDFYSYKATIPIEDSFNCYASTDVN